MLNAERRPSMAERRPSFFSPGPDGSLQSTSLVVPHLAGIEDPLPETTPEQVDVLIAGTGLIESILSASLAWQGSTVLHIDSNNYYGDTWATMTIDQLKNWTNQVNEDSDETRFYKDARLYVSGLVAQGKFKSKNFGIDLSPKILFAQSDLLSVLIKSRVHQYLEFQSLSNFHTFENDNFERLTNSKQEIFTDQTLPLMTKRNLMRFIKFVLEWEKNTDIWKPYAEQPLASFLVDKFKLEKPQIFELIFSIGMCRNLDTKTPEGLARIRRFLTSFDVYGPFPVLYSKYGGPGELSQGFCRSAAVAGATYKLNHKLVSYDPNSQTAVFEDGSRVRVTEKVVASPTQHPQNGGNIPPQKYEVHRLTCVVEKDCSQWFSEGENAAMVVFPPDSLKTGNVEAVQVVILGSGAEVCEPGTCIWYFSTTQAGPRGDLDLDAALEAMINSILRESSDIPNEDELVQINSNGVPLVNSVKLGQSFKELISKEQVNFIMKLYYTQYTSTPPFDIVTPDLFDLNKSKEFIPGASDNGILYTSLPSGEVSYDEVITAAKFLYEKIVGSDDDFFDLDFENDEPDLKNTNKTINSYDESAIADDEEDIQMMDSEPVEFAGEMEI
ncbi:Mrs6 [Kluyveromyces lactis]|nr:Mrs6 [Kluyveromyces lactis]